MRNILKPVSIFLVILLSSVLLSGCTISDEKIVEYNQIISSADLLIESQEYTSAIERLSEAVDLVPSKPEAFERIVNILILKNRLEDATKLIDESGVDLEDKDRARFYVLIGDAQYKVGNYERALYNYQLAKGMSGDNKDASFGMAKTYIQKGKSEDAKSLLKENYTGDMLIEAKLLTSYIEAVSDSEKAKNTIKDIEPGDEWRDGYTQWVGVLDSLDSNTLYNTTKLGKQYVDSGYPYLAIAVLEPNLTQMSEYIDGIYILGKAYYEYGEYQKSIDLLENSSTLSNLNQYIYWVLARDYYLLDDVNEAISYYDSATSYAANDAEETLYIEYLDILIEENLTEKALEVMRSAIRIFDRDWVDLYYMDIYSLRDDSDKFFYHMAKVDYEKLSDDQKADYLYSKAEYMINNSELDEAQRTLDIFWELNEYDARYNFLMARLYFENGKLDESRTYAKQAIEFDLNGTVSENAQKLLAQID